MTGSSIQLFCVPFAGGTARAYRAWQHRFGPAIEVVALELPGRGARSAEPFPGSLRQAAADLAAQAAGRWTGGRYVLFGHSMGALLAYEVALRRELHALPSPTLLVVSGRNPPHVPAQWGAEVLQLPDRELFAALAEVGGIPAGLTVSIAASFFLPQLRADLRLVCEYLPGAGDTRPGTPVDAPLVIMSGRQDPLVDQDRVSDWARYTVREASLLPHDGQHFAILHQPGALRQVLGALVITEDEKCPA
jgi:medium-chain acyl-[acyl-carrier-protein] hydrolase